MTERYFRKKPVVIRAFKLGDNIPDWAMDRVTQNIIVLQLDRGMPVSGSAEIHTLEGVMHADAGDYIIEGVKGEVYPCKADIFAATYEEFSDWTDTASAAIGGG